MKLQPQCVLLAQFHDARQMPARLAQPGPAWPSDCAHHRPGLNKGGKLTQCAHPCINPYCTIWLVCDTGHESLGHHRFSLRHDDHTVA